MDDDIVFSCMKVQGKIIQQQKGREIMNIIIPKEQESYQEYMERILSFRENKRDQENYQERHHIIPLSCGGSNQKENLIFLYAQEHYYAHKLLAQENQDNIKLQYAWWNMCQCSQNNQRVYIVTAEDYAVARENFVCSMKNNQYAAGQKLSQSTKEKMSAAHKNKLTGQKNPMYGKHCTEKVKNILREKLSGVNNPQSRKVKCLETDEIFSTVTEAAKWANIHRSDIAASINGKQKSAGKHPATKEKLHWVYVE